MLSELITKREGVKYTVFHCIHFLPCIPLEYTYSFFISAYSATREISLDKLIDPSFVDEVVVRRHS